MNVLTMAGAVLLAGHAAAATAAEQGLPRVVSEVTLADYRGERGELHRLAGELERLDAPELAAYRHYWRGFALWRSAINGFNETPLPADVPRELEDALAAFKAALVARPGWIEAKVGMVGCWSYQLWLSRDDAARRDAILKDALPVVAEMKSEGAANPRALWLAGQSQLGGGGRSPDPVKAAATLRRGIEAALDEARARAADEPAWIPRWGGAENLMNLAYLYAHSTLADRDLARAYAEGALVAAPEWHFVRDILLPQIDALPPRPPAAAATTPAATPAPSQ
jgi:hypothetical protein